MAMKAKRFCTVALCLLSVGVPHASANVIYTFTGAQYTENSDPSLLGTYLTGSITCPGACADGTYLSAELADITFTSGTVSISTSITPYVNIFTGDIVISGGAIADYELFIDISHGVQAGISMQAALEPSPYSFAAAYSQSAYAGSGGVWSEGSPAVTPLPAALPLFATGLGVMGLLGWRRKRKAAAISTA
jgi:hypothetical protein